MEWSRSSLRVSTCLLVALLFAGCGGERRPGRGGGSGSGGDSTAETFTPPSRTEGDPSSVPEHATTVRCDASIECDYWFCRCEDGALVNAASCVNGYCLDDAGACPEACDLFGHGRWVSTAGGGPSARDSTDPEATDPAPAGPGWHPVCDEDFADGCIRCAQRLCCEQLGACIDSEACLDYTDCIDACAGSAACEAECESLHPLGASDFRPLDSCMARTCDAACDSGFP